MEIGGLQGLPDTERAFNEACGCLRRFARETQYHLYESSKNGHGEKICQSFGDGGNVDLNVGALENTLEVHHQLLNSLIGASFGTS